MARRWRNTSSLHTNVAVVSSVFFQAKHAVVIAFGCSVLVPIKWANVNGSLFTSSECHWHTAKDILYCVRRFAPLLMWPSLEWPFAVGVEKKKRNSPFLPFLSCINTMEVHGCCRQQITYLQEQRNKREFQGELNSRQPMGYSCSIGQIKLKAIPFLCNNRPVLVKPPPPPPSTGERWIFTLCTCISPSLFIFLGSLQQRVCVPGGHPSLCWYGLSRFKLFSLFCGKV